MLFLLKRRKRLRGARAMSKGASGLFSGTKGSTSNVWNNITATQPNYVGTEIPRSFIIKTPKKSFWSYATLNSLFLFLSLLFFPFSFYLQTNIGKKTSQYLFERFSTVLSYYIISFIRNHVNFLNSLYYCLKIYIFSIFKSYF